MSFLCKVTITDPGGPAHSDLDELNQALHRNINSTRGYRPRLNSPAERLEHRDRKHR